MAFLRIEHLFKQEQAFDKLHIYINYFDLKFQVSYIFVSQAQHIYYKLFQKDFLLLISNLEKFIIFGINFNITYNEYNESSHLHISLSQNDLYFAKFAFYFSKIFLKLKIELY